MSHDEKIATLRDREPILAIMHASFNDLLTRKDDQGILLALASEYEVTPVTDVLEALAALIAVEPLDSIQYSYQSSIVRELPEVEGGLPYLDYGSVSIKTGGPLTNWIPDLEMVIEVVERLSIPMSQLVVERPRAGPGGIEEMLSKYSRHRAHDHRPAANFIRLFVGRRGVEYVGTRGRHLYFQIRPNSYAGDEFIRIHLVDHQT